MLYITDQQEHLKYADNRRRLCIGYTLRLWSCVRMCGLLEADVLQEASDPWIVSKLSPVSVCSPGTASTSINTPVPSVDLLTDHQSPTGGLPQ